MRKPRVLLARPHPFIIESMRAYLDRHGLEPEAVKHFDELDGKVATEFRGVVISASAGTTVHRSYFEVLSKVRELFPGLPVAFSTLFSSPGTLAGIRECLGSNGLSVDLAVARELKEDGQGVLRRMPRPILVISRNDLEQGCPLLAEFFGGSAREGKI